MVSTSIIAKLWLYYSLQATKSSKGISKLMATYPLLPQSQISWTHTILHFATTCPCFLLSDFHYFQNDSCFLNGSWSIRQILDFSNIPSISSALGRSFDPLIHLEQQRNFEDIIKAEQVDADLQNGRRHSPNHSLHTISDYDSDSNTTISNTQFLSRRRHILNTRRVHPLSTSEVPLMS